MRIFRSAVAKHAQMLSCVYRNIKGNPGITAALDQATEAAQMASLYDMLDEAGQREVLLRELEYAAEVAVDKLSQDGLV